MKSIWFKPFQPADMEGQFPNTMMEHLDIKVLEIGSDYITGSMPVDKRTHQIFGWLHGGASMVLAETLGSMAAYMTLDSGRQFCVGQEINGNHLRSVTSGRVIGTARPHHIGGSSQVWGIDIRDENGQAVCISRITMAIRDRR